MWTSKLGEQIQPKSGLDLRRWTALNWTLTLLPRVLEIKEYCLKSNRLLLHLCIFCIKSVMLELNQAHSYTRKLSSCPFCRRTAASDRFMVHYVFVSQSHMWVIYNIMSHSWLFQYSYGYVDERMLCGCTCCIHTYIEHVSFCCYG